jgi:hypothetical protein
VLIYNKLSIYIANLGNGVADSLPCTTGEDGSLENDQNIHFDASRQGALSEMNSQVYCNTRRTGNLDITEARTTTMNMTFKYTASLWNSLDDNYVIIPCR